MLQHLISDAHNLIHVIGLLLALWGVMVIAGGVLAGRGLMDMVRGGVLIAVGYGVAGVGAWFS